MEPVITQKFISKIELLHLSVKDNVSGLFGGTHKNKNKGSSCEFADFKKYEEGDDINRIDWRIYARSEMLFIKQYLDERQMHTRIYIDGSESMSYGNKGKYALQLAAALSYLSVNSMDKVSIYVIHDNKCDCLIDRMLGKDSFLNKINILNKTEFTGECHVSESLMRSSVGYGDGLSIILSDFLTDNDYKKGIDYLREKKRDVLCLQVLSPEEINPKYNGRFHFFDSENSNFTFRRNINREVLRAYQKAFEFLTKDISDYCLSRGGNYLLVPTDKALEEFFFKDAVRKEVIR